MELKTDITRDGPRCTVAITIPASEAARRLEGEIAQVAVKARLPGFRPGKAPATLLRRRYGAGVLGDVLGKLVDAASAKALADAGLRPALKPDFAGNLEGYDLAALDAGTDIAYTLTFEPLPDITIGDLSALSFEKLTAKPGEADIDRALENLAKSHAKEGAEPPTIDDAFAENVGAKDLDTLRGYARERLTEELADAARTRLKMAVMDALDAAHTVDPPPSLVEQEHTQIMQQVEQELAHRRAQDADGPKEASDLTDAQRDEYRDIAGRRVRLGLLLAEIARAHALEVSGAELSQAAAIRARMFPGHEKQMYDMIASSPQMLEAIRAPLLEDKAIDFVLERATVTEREVTPEELFGEDEDEAPKPPKKAPAKKRSAPKKAAPKKAAGEKTETPAKKPTAKKIAAKKKE
jgi:FKBP-type peptidyl-prolyl cis-trans isomerase (trigger factor)